MQIKRVGLISMIWTAFAFSLTSVAAVPTDAVLQTCQKRVEEELPETDIEAVAFDRATALFNAGASSETVVIHWRTATGITGSCRVATSDGAMVEFVNPYALPRGQRPIETVMAFQTDDYTVRVVRLSQQFYMNVYNRRTDRVELNRELVRSFNSEAGTVYTNLLGQRFYQSIVLPDGTYRLMIRFGSELVVYDQAGYPLANPEAAAIQRN